MVVARDDCFHGSLNRASTGRSTLTETEKESRTEQVSSAQLGNLQWAVPSMGFDFSHLWLWAPTPLSSPLHNQKGPNSTPPFYPIFFLLYKIFINVK